MNCYLTEIEDNDFHINLVPDPDLDEYSDIVTEMTPRRCVEDGGKTCERWRPAHWTLEMLDMVREARRKILVRGHLMLDHVHKKRTNFEMNKFGNSPRFSVWEIHPITELFVCLRLNNSCHDTEESDWTAL